MRLVAGMLVAWLAAGCATTPYPFATHGETDLTLKLRDDEPQFERGEPNKWVDGFGHYFFSLPSKLILLNWHVNNHDVGPEVEQAMQDYLWANGLCNLKVRLNQYAPGGEWQRLSRNREMPGFWRYTFGAISVGFYTIFPERLFAGFPFIGGGDHYNPYTNTVSIYSGVQPIVLHEGGHAKDFASQYNRTWKGFYAALRAIPLVGIPFTLWQEAVASNDALSWELAVGDSADSKAAYRILYPAYGTYIGGSASEIAGYLIDGWILYAIQYGVVVAGHVTGQTRALFVRERPEGLEPEILVVMAENAEQAAELQRQAELQREAELERALPPDPNATPAEPDQAIPPAEPDQALPPAEPETTAAETRDPSVPTDYPAPAPAEPAPVEPEAGQAQAQLSSSPVTPPHACSAVRNPEPR